MDLVNTSPGTGDLGTEGTLTVTYTLRELLERIESRTASIDVKLDGKASVKHVQDVERRVADLELSRAKLLGAQAAIGFLAGGGGYVLATLAGSPGTS